MAFGTKSGNSNKHRILAQLIEQRIAIRNNFYKHFYSLNKLDKTTELAQKSNSSITNAFTFVYGEMLKSVNKQSPVLPVAQTTPATKSLREQVVVAAPD